MNKDIENFFRVLEKKHKSCDETLNRLLKAIRELNEWYKEASAVNPDVFKELKEGL